MHTFTCIMCTGTPVSVYGVSVGGTGLWGYLGVRGPMWLLICVVCACTSAGCESLWVSVEIHVWVWVCLLLWVGVSV